MGFLFGANKWPPPVIIAPPPPTVAPKAKTPLQETVDVQAEEAAVGEVERVKKKRGLLSTITTSGQGILEKGPVSKKKLGE